MNEKYVVGDQFGQKIRKPELPVVEKQPRFGKIRKLKEKIKDFLVVSPGSFEGPSSTPPLAVPPEIRDFSNTNEQPAVVQEFVFDQPFPLTGRDKELFLDWAQSEGETSLKNVRKIYAGADGTVYHYRFDSGKNVALKTPHFNTNHLIRNETKALRKLNGGEDIIQAVFIPKSESFIVLEFSSGEQMHQFFKSEKVGAPTYEHDSQRSRAIRFIVAFKILKAVDFAMDHDVFPIDIKDDNFLLKCTADDAIDASVGMVDINLDLIDFSVAQIEPDMSDHETAEKIRDFANDIATQIIKILTGEAFSGFELIVSSHQRDREQVVEDGIKAQRKQLIARLKRLGIPEYMSDLLAHACVGRNKLYGGKLKTSKDITDPVTLVKQLVTAFRKSVSDDEGISVYFDQGYVSSFYDVPAINETKSRRLARFRYAKKIASQFENLPTEELSYLGYARIIFQILTGQKPTTDSEKNFLTLTSTGLWYQSSEMEAKILADSLSDQENIEETAKSALRLVRSIGYEPTGLGGGHRYFSFKTKEV